MSEPHGSARPLAVLRAMIDSLDHEILQLLARRIGIVAEIASWKRSHGTRIRDVSRERALLEDRRERAEELGLPPNVVESIYRLVLLASREHQAALRTEVPLDLEPRTVAILGGHGGMGALMARLFSDLGHTVLVADVGTELSNIEAAKAADVVVVSVPIDKTLGVIREVGPHVRAGGLLMDITSLKEEPMAAMLAATSASVIGTHPMFGPGVHTLQGQRFVLCEGRGADWASWLRRMLHARGLVVTDATPREHDRAMAVVQVLSHYRTQVTALALARLGVPLDETLRFTSPAYLMDLYVEGRHFAQSPELYAQIEMGNPRTAEVTRVFGDAAAELAEVLADSDVAGFRAMFAEVRAYFGAFTETALEQSSFLIDRLVERS